MKRTDPPKSPSAKKPLAFERTTLRRLDDVEQREAEGGTWTVTIQLTKGTFTPLTTLR